jgi:hypothetical protein
MPSVDPARIQHRNEQPPSEGGYVLYWMQQSQRATNNPALEYAIGRSNEEGVPLLVVFGLMDDYPEANRRHYTFMLEGLQETQARTPRTPWRSSPIAATCAISGNGGRGWRRRRRVRWCRWRGM